MTPHFKWETVIKISAIVAQGPNKKHFILMEQKTCGLMNQMHWQARWLFRNTTYACQNLNCLYFLTYLHNIHQNIRSHPILFWSWLVFKCVKEPVIRSPNLCSKHDSRKFIMTIQNYKSLHCPLNMVWKYRNRWQTFNFQTNRYKVSFFNIKQATFRQYYMFCILKITFQHQSQTHTICLSDSLIIFLGDGQCFHLWKIIEKGTYSKKV